jgi:hypothetical protein
MPGCQWSGRASRTVWPVSNRSRTAAARAYAAVRRLRTTRVTVTSASGTATPFSSTPK